MSNSTIQGDESIPTPAKRSAKGFGSSVEGVNAMMDGKEEQSNCPSTVPWLWVPRGGSPACRLVSQVAREAARFGEAREREDFVGFGFRGMVWENIEKKSAFRKTVMF